MARKQILKAIGGAMLLLTGALAFGGEPPKPAKGDEGAFTLLRDASNRQYRWEDDLRTFSADFTLTREGKAVTGSVVVKATVPHGGVQVTCDDASAKPPVQEMLEDTVLHTRSRTFEQGFGTSSFALGGPGVYGGTVVKLTGHPFFQDFTVKEGFIIQNHGLGFGLQAEVNVHTTTWVAELGKTMPHEYSATITSGAGAARATRSVHVWEEWSQTAGNWFPTRYRSETAVGEKKSELSLLLEGLKVEKAPPSGK